MQMVVLVGRRQTVAIAAGCGVVEARLDRSRCW